MNEIWGNSSSLGWVALKAALLFLTAVAGFRVSGRRTLAELSVIDFAAAVAVGAIIGRVPNSTTTSFVQGATTIVSIFVLHNVLARLRYVPTVSNLLDHQPLLLVIDGTVQEGQLRRCGLTVNDLNGLLRHSGVRDCAELRLVIFEQSGSISVVRHPASGRENLLEPLTRSFPPRAR